MGREIRRVPPNWNHPTANRHGRSDLQPMYDRRFEDAAAEWKEAFAAWERGERPSYCGEENKHLEYWEYNGAPPERAYYRPWTDEEATWYQVWETVSEGTPVTPPFETPAEVIDYLVANGDFWDQQRRAEGTSSIPYEPWTRRQAEAFVGTGWAPSFVVGPKGVQSGVEFVADSKAAD